MDNCGAFTINQFVTWSNIGRSSVFSYISKGELKTKKLGRRTLILRKDAQAFLDSLPEGRP